MSVRRTAITLLLAVSLALTFGPATGQTCPNAKYPYFVLYNRACCNFPMHLTSACCINAATNECYCAAHKRPTDFWAPSACFQTTPATTSPPQALLCPRPITQRMLGGTVVTDPCQDRGVIGFYFNASTVGGAGLNKICHGVYSFDAAKGRRVLRMSEHCWKLLVSLEQIGSGYGGILLKNDFALKAAYMEGITYFRDLVPTNGYVTMYPDRIMESYLDSKVNSSCSNVACELGNSVSPEQINFNDCKIMSYGAAFASSSVVVPTDYVLKSVPVKMSLTWGGTPNSPCQSMLAEQNIAGGSLGGVTPVCFVSKNYGDANCGATDAGAPMYCKTLDGREDVFVGFNGFSSSCLRGPVNAFAIHPFP